MNDLTPLINSFMSFAQERLGFDRPPKLFFKQDSENAKDFFGKTAHYDPRSESVTVFVTDRHPKDIMRSLAHELVHHVQNLRGDLSPEKCGDLGPGYAQTNKHMREMERQAFEKGNLCFRDFCDQYKKQLQEVKFLKESKKMTKKITKSILKQMIRSVLKEQMDMPAAQRAKAASDSKPQPKPKSKTKKKRPSVPKGCDNRTDKSDKMVAEVEDKKDDAKAKKAKCDNCKNCGCKGKGCVDCVDCKDCNPVDKSKDSKIKENEELEENAFVLAADAAADQGKKQFEFPKGSGKMHKVKLKKGGDTIKNESKIYTPEQEQELYESRFNDRNDRIFDKLKKLWTK